MSDKKAREFHVEIMRDVGETEDRLQMAETVEAAMPGNPLARACATILRWILRKQREIEADARQEARETYKR